MARRESARDRRKPNPNVRLRRLRFQTLEDRICLAFTDSYDPGTSTLRFEGTAAADILMDIAIDATSGNVRFQTDGAGGWIETDAPARTSANPLWISISGLDGDDDVGRPGLLFSFAGFAHYSVAHFTFDGGRGKDRLFLQVDSFDHRRRVESHCGEEGPALPSIVFLGKEGRDELHGNNYAEYLGTLTLP